MHLQPTPHLKLFLKKKHSFFKKDKDKVKKEEVKVSSSTRKMALENAAMAREHHKMHTSHTHKNAQLQCTFGKKQVKSLSKRCTHLGRADYREST